MKNICKTIFLWFLTLVISPWFSFSQTAPGIQWQNTIGGTLEDRLESIHQTSDKGYIISGHSTSNISGDKAENCLDTTAGALGDYWIIKLDSAGNIQWQNTIGGYEYDFAWNARETADGGFIVGGYTLSDSTGDKTEHSRGEYDYWIVKLDISGIIVWQKTFGGDQFDYLKDIRPTHDGGYIVGGKSFSNISGDKTENSMGLDDWWLLRLDSLGNILWQNTIGGNSNDLLATIQETADNGFIGGGYSVSNNSGDKSENCLGEYDYWVVKLDSSGTIQWQNTMGGDSVDNLLSIDITSDGGYFVSGISRSNISGDKTEASIGESDFWILKLDASGNIQWQNTIGGTGTEHLYAGVQTADGGYFLTGWSDSPVSGDKTEGNLGGFDYWIMKLDSVGNIIWQNTIGGTAFDALYSGEQTTDLGFILGGISSSGISADKTENTWGGNDYWVIKLAPETITGISDLQSLFLNIQVFPNPATNEFNIKTNDNGLFEIILYDIASRKLVQQKFTNSVSIITEQLLQGIYIYELRSKNGLCKKGKVVKE